MNLKGRKRRIFGLSHAANVSIIVFRCILPFDHFLWPCFCYASEIRCNDDFSNLDVNDSKANENVGQIAENTTFLMF
jgi:hypothetical protein